MLNGIQSQDISDTDEIFWNTENFTFFVLYYGN